MLYSGMIQAFDDDDQDQDYGDDNDDYEDSHDGDSDDYEDDSDSDKNDDDNLNIHSIYMQLYADSSVHHYQHHCFIR